MFQNWNYKRRDYHSFDKLIKKHDEEEHTLLYAINVLHVEVNLTTGALLYVNPQRNDFFTVYGNQRITGLYDASIVTKQHKFLAPTIENRPLAKREVVDELV